LADIR